jgi:hypothetical protein
MGGRFEPIHSGELKGSSHQILEGKEIIGENEDTKTMA